MKAVVYKEPFEVAVEEVDDPRIRAPERRDRPGHLDRDLRLRPAHVRGPHGRRARHRLRARELGIVEEVGAGSRAQAGRPRRDALQRRLRLLQELRRRLHGLLPHREPGLRRRRLRLRGDGPVHGWPGGVPARPLRRLQLPEAAPRGREHENDFVLLADIFPTGYHGSELARSRPERASRSTAPGRSA